MKRASGMLAIPIKSIGSPSITRETRAKTSSASRANQPVVSSSAPAAACRRGAVARGSGGCRRGRRSSRARAPSRRCRCRSRCRRGRSRRPRPSRTTSRRARGRAPRVERRAVERVLAEDAERHLVGDRLADQRGPGVEQRLHGPGVPRGHRMVPRPVRIAAAGRMARDVEEVLRGEGEAGQRTVRPALGNAHGGTGDEGAGHGGILRDRARLPGTAIASLDTRQIDASRAHGRSARARSSLPGHVAGLASGCLGYHLKTVIGRACGLSMTRSNHPSVALHERPDRVMARSAGLRSGWTAPSQYRHRQQRVRARRYARERTWAELIAERLRLWKSIANA